MATTKFSELELQQSSRREEAVARLWHSLIPAVGFDKQRYKKAYLQVLKCLGKYNKFPDAKKAFAAYELRTAIIANLPELKEFPLFEDSAAMLAVWYCRPLEPPKESKEGEPRPTVTPLEFEELMELESDRKREATLRKRREEKLMECVELAELSVAVQSALSHWLHSLSQNSESISNVRSPKKRLRRSRCPSRRRQPLSRSLRKRKRRKRRSKAKFSPKKKRVRKNCL